MPTNDKELEELIETVKGKLIATHKIVIEAKIADGCSEKDETEKLETEIKEWLSSWINVSLELLQIKDGKIEIILFYTSEISNTMRNGIAKIESEEEVLEKTYFYLQNHISSAYIKIKKEDIKVEQFLLPEEENQFLVLF